MNHGKARLAVYKRQYKKLNYTLPYGISVATSGLVIPAGWSWEYNIQRNRYFMFKIGNRRSRIHTSVGGYYFR